MTTDKKKMTITFAPGAFDNFDGTQEELDGLVAEIQRMADSGELEENSIPLDTDDVMDTLTDEDREQVLQALSNMSDNIRKKLQ
jgi:hypothetical protein